MPLGRAPGPALYLIPPVAIVYCMLSSGRIPAVVLSDGGVLSVQSEDDGPYTAIPHVWAGGGLGSTTEAGLPTCQLARITRLLVSDSAFWVDSLCVLEVQERHKAAIRFMAESYQCANAIVV